MAAGPKYLVFSYDDVRKHLSAAEKTALKEMVEKIVAGRQAAKRQPHVVFVLNMQDRYAQPAIEKYIDAIQTDMDHRNDPGVVAALAAAVDTRTRGLMNVEQRLPT